MWLLILLLVCVPLQFALISYRKSFENVVLMMTDFFQKHFNFKIKNGWSWDKEKPATDEHQATEDDSEHFAVNTRRPPELKFRVGQVVVNTRDAFVAIIIGWRAKGGNEPEYELLVDHPSVPEYKTTSPQSDLILLQYVEIYHPEAVKYFSMFDHTKSQYVPQPWLRIVYPTD